MGIGLSGLTSGLDTDAVIEAMVMEKTARKDKYVKAQTKVQWKQDAWKTLNNKIYSFYTKSLSNIRLAGSFNKKTVSVSNPTIATVVAQTGSVEGTQTLAVEQLAKAGYLTGGQVKTIADGKVSGSTTMSELGVSGASFNITVAGKESVIQLNGDMTVNDLVSKLKSAGVNANFDAGNQRFFISAKESGKDNDFSFTAADSSGIAALKSLGLYTGASAADVAQYRTWADYTAEKIQELITTAYEAQKTDADKEKALLQTEIEDLTKTNESLTEKNKTLTEEKELLEYKKSYAQKYLDGTNSAEYTSVKDELDELEELVKNGTTLTEEQQTKYDELKDKMSAIQEVDAAIGNEAATTTEQREEYIAGLTEEITAKTTAIDENNVAIAANTTAIAEKQAIVDDAAALAQLASEKNFGEDGIQDENGGIYGNIVNQINAKWETAKNYMIQYNYNNGDEAYKLANQAAYNASVAAIGDIKASGSTDGTGAVRVEGQNAIIYVNGAKFEGTNNTINVNGLSITAQEVTGKDANGNLNTVSVTTSTNAQGVYDMVKNFLKEYNELINEMDKLYNAESTRGYEPLTTEEKEEMTDDEIKLWETKIKDGLLRRDSSLNNIIQVMKNSMAGGVNIDGKQSYLFEFGIETAGYLYAAQNERGAYHIAGDEDDAISGSKADKLMAAIMEDPDRVAEVLSGVASNMYNNMTKVMRSTSLSSSYTVYNDKQLATEYSNYTEKIAEQEEKITWWEDYYRSRFTAMESMLASLNQQQSSLSGLLGV